MCDILYLWNLTYDELYKALLNLNNPPHHIHIARQEVDERLEAIARKKGVELSYAKNAFTESICEFALASIFMLSKNLHLVIARKQWEKYTQEKVHASNVLILGKGSIGTALASRLHKNGINAHFAGRDEIQAFSRGFNLFSNEFTSTLSSVVCCLPLNKSTEKLLDASFFSHFNAINFINISRGAIVDTNALETAVTNGNVRAAVLDAFETEPLPQNSSLWSNENIVVSSHQSYRSPDWEALLHSSFLKLIN
jgi:phosphoglycerate dehydrogenase-like enzyme